MLVEDCFYLGHVRKAHGIHGESKAYFDVDFIESYVKQESVYILKDEKLAPVFFESMRVIGAQLAIVKFRNVHTRSDAEAMQGLSMYLPLEQLPELKKGQFYYHEIVGYEILDKKLGSIGKVIRVDEMPAHDLMIFAHQKKEIPVPVTYEFVLEADHEKKVLHTNLPDGLIDVYI